MWISNWPHYYQKVKNKISLFKMRQFFQLKTMKWSVLDIKTLYILFLLGEIVFLQKKKYYNKLVKIKIEANKYDYV